MANQKLKLPALQNGGLEGSLNMRFASKEAAIRYLQKKARRGGDRLCSHQGERRENNFDNL